MHAIYTTPGLIIGSRPYGEAGKRLSIFTRDFGLVLAAAQGIRLERSKLRHYAQDYSFGAFSLVKGRESWRLVNADGSSVALPRRADRELVARIALLLKRLLPGEEANPELFDRLEACAAFLSSGLPADGERLKTLESITVFGILCTLGYIGEDKALARYASSSRLTPELVDLAAPKRSALNRHINKALKESHL
jgi:recombinational DNA repair protein (RecF pathway)